MKKQDFKPKLVIGLGNPGEKYSRTFHNIGKLLIEHLSGNSSFKKYRDFEYLKTKGLIFIKPLTFMNTSGKTANSALKFFKIKPSEMLVIHDDADIELGKYKLTFGQSSAGHKGVESVISSVGTKDFWRLRIGIRKPPLSRLGGTRRTKAEDMVLKKISKKDLEILQITFSDIKTHLLTPLL